MRLLQNIYLKLLSKVIYGNRTFLKIAEIEQLLWLITFGQQPRFKKLATEEIKGLKPKHVLQIGCVPGPLSRDIAQVIPDRGELFIIDTSEKALEITKEKLKDLKNIKLRRLDAADSKLPSAEFDVIVLFFLLHEVHSKTHEVHSKTKIKIFDEAERLLKSGGTLLFVDYHKTNSGRVASIIEKLIRFIEPLSGELMDMNLNRILRNRGFRTKKLLLGRFGLYQFLVATKR